MRTAALGVTPWKRSYRVEDRSFGKQSSSLAYCLSDADRDNNALQQLAARFLRHQELQIKESTQISVYYYLSKKVCPSNLREILPAIAIRLVPVVFPVNIIGAVLLH